MGRTTKILIQNIWDKKRKKRALVILLISDLCLFIAGGYLIISWIRMNEHEKPMFVFHQDRSNRHPLPDGNKTPDTPDMKQVRETLGNGNTEKYQIIPEKSDDTNEEKPAHETESERRKNNNSHDGKDAISVSREDESDDAKKEQRNFLSLVHNLLGKRTSEFQSCHAKAVKLQGQSLTGSILIRFHLKKDGRIDNVSIHENTTGSSWIENCLLRETRKIRFPKPPKGAREFLYPLSFSAQ